MPALGSVLVIGGCGGLGYNLVKQILDSGDATEMTVLDINTERNRIDGPTYMKGSVSSREDVSTVLAKAKPTVIFHVASPHLMHQSATPKLFEEVNVSGTRNLLDCIHEQKSTKVLVYTSRSGIIHNGYTNIIRATEDTPIWLFPEQTEYYAHTKALADVMIREENRKHGLLTCDNTTIPQMVGNAQAGRGKMQVGNGQKTPDFTYLGNAAYGHILAAKKLLEVNPSAPPPAENERIDREAFFITNDEPWKFWEFVKAVGAAAGCATMKEYVRVVPTWFFYTMAMVAEWAVSRLVGRSLR